jgi:hypothetical protein
MIARTELTSGLEKTLLVVEFQPQRLSSVRKVVSLPRLGGLHHAIHSRPNNCWLRTRFPRCQDGSEIHAWILAIQIARMIPKGSDTSKTTLCNAPLS